MRISDWSSDVCSSDLTVGGGSTTGLGKALALRTGLPQSVVPTTYAGSEVTSLLGQTEDGVKTTLRDPAILPSTVIYDVELTLTLPVTASITSALNAAAHAVEALYAPDATPLRSEEHTSELQSLMRISYAVFCLKKKNNNKEQSQDIQQ